MHASHFFLSNLLYNALISEIWMTNTILAQLTNADNPLDTMVNIKVLVAPSLNLLAIDAHFG